MGYNFLPAINSMLGFFGGGWDRGERVVFFCILPCNVIMCVVCGEGNGRK